MFGRAVRSQTCAPECHLYTFSGRPRAAAAVDGSPVEAEAGSLILLDGEAPTTARTLSETARFVWFFEPTFLQAGRSHFRFHEPISMRNASLRALIAMTNSVIDAPPPTTETARRHLGISLEHLVAGALDEAGSDELGGDSRHQDGLFMAAQLAIETHFRDAPFGSSRCARYSFTSSNRTAISPASNHSPSCLSSRRTSSSVMRHMLPPRPTDATHINPPSVSP